MAAVAENTNTNRNTYPTSPTESDQRSPTTRMFSLVEVASTMLAEITSDAETRDIERNVEFHNTIVQRVHAPRRLVDATDVGDL
jgi:hypothetical protein